MDLTKLKEMVKKAEELTKMDYKNTAAEKINAKFNALEARKQEFFQLKSKNQAGIERLEAQIKELRAKIPTSGDKARTLFDQAKEMENELEFLKLQSQTKYKPVLAAEAQAIAESPEWAQAGKEYTLLMDQTNQLIDEFNNIGREMALHLANLRNVHPYAAAIQKKNVLTNGDNAY